jgi:hypothetical protein
MASRRNPRTRGETTSQAIDNAPEQPRFLTMIGLVALLVAITILVFFGIGYLFGRVFL